MTTAMMSPTQRLIQQQCNGVDMREQQPVSEVELLRSQNEVLRRKLAHLTAQYVWAEGGSFAKINQEIRQYGYKLQRMDNAYDPCIVPITKVVSEISAPPREKVYGRKPEPHEGRA